MSRTEVHRPLKFLSKQPFSNELAYHELKLYLRHNPPKWYRRYGWEKPERQRVRVEVSRLVREFNSPDDIDDADVDCPQHRHQAIWQWW